MRKRTWLAAGLLAMLCWGTMGCPDDNPSEPIADALDADSSLRDVPGEATGDLELDGQDVPTEGGEDAPPLYLGHETQGAGSEWPDCLSGCDHAHPLSPVLDIIDLPFDALWGVIDGDEHIFYVQSVEYVGPDVDLLAVTLPTRTMLEIRVEPADSSSPVHPLVITHDGFNYMTFNAGVAADDVSARTVVASPYVGDLPFYIAFQDANNYDNTPAGPFVGGEEYAYLVWFDTWGFAPVELGELNATNSPITVTGARIEQSGDIHYYRLTAPTADATGQNPEVKFTRTGSEDFTGFMAGMNTIGGQLVWDAGSWVFDEDHDGEITLPGSAFVACNTTPCESEGEYIFVVMDWNGAVFPGEFTYNLEISLP
ncbi:MAG: hypothetical protein JW797_19490 [Bradymonadales bacterium]|nr:hypothetical protein [Bradymonadales bacterium]